jgi:hypothetical protein
MVTTRLNISVPKDFVKRVKEFAPNGNVSKFIVESTEGELAKKEREAAMSFFDDVGPLFPEIKNSAKYVHELRKKDATHRMKKIGI